MTTRLEDAVISVRIETGKARSQIQSLKGDLGDQAGGGGPGGGGVFPPGGTGGGGGGGEGGTKVPGTSAAGGGGGGSGTGTGGGAGGGSPGELQNPLKYLRAVQDLRNVVQSRSPQEVLSAAGGLVEQMPGWAGAIGSTMRMVASVPEAAVAIMELASNLQDPWGGTSAATGLLGDLLPDGAAKEWLSAITELGEAGGGTFWRAISQAKELGDTKGAWMQRGGDEEDRTWEAAQRKIDKLISGVTAAQQSFSETKTMSGMTSLAAGHAYTKNEYMTHFNRFAEYHDFSYQLRRRNQRQMRYEMGLHTFQSLLTSFGDMADYATGWTKRAF